MSHETSRSDGPTEITLRIYQVGFGDCLLLTFHYPRTRRNVLVDFGTSSLPEGAPADHMVAVARDIERVCDGKLDAVIATHRHRDHTSGFGGEPGRVIAACDPDLVVQPWTEDPEAEDEPAAGESAHRARGVRRALDAMQLGAESVLAALRARTETITGEHAALAATAENNLRLPAAARRLADMGHRHEYLHFGAPTRLEEILPGVRVHVLGPPTIEQYEGIRRQRERDPEYWHLAAAGRDYWSAVLAAADHFEACAATDGAAAAEPFPDAEVWRPAEIPRHMPWFMRRVDEALDEETRGFVHALDDVLNNTSLILLLETGQARLLLPGDAQIEDWALALARPELRALCAGATVYKVGHHGSLNATPLSLWNGFAHLRSRGQGVPLQTVLSTRPGVHGREGAHTEVPRKRLVAALRKESECVSTASPTDFPPGLLARDLHVHV